MHCEQTGHRTKQADSKIMQQYSKRVVNITPPCPNDSIEYVELSSSDNDVVKLTNYIVCE